MDFELSQAERNMQRLAREFAKDNFVVKKAIELEEKHEYPFDVWKKLGEAGLICVDYPEDYGGRGLSFTSTIVEIVELCGRLRKGSRIWDGVVPGMDTLHPLRRVWKQGTVRRIPGRNDKGKISIGYLLYGARLRKRPHLGRHNCYPKRRLLYPEW
jgi:hypothetical protein